MTISVHQVTTADQVNEFIDLPNRLHAKATQYVPPLRRILRRRLNLDRLKAGKNDVRLFLATDEDEIVGRISVMSDPTHNDHKDENVAWFGFFECINSKEVAEALIAAATTVAKEWGAAVLRGQRNLTRWDDPGITVEGFDTHPPMFAAYHPAYYPDFFKEAGFTKHHDLLAYDVDLFLANGAPRPLPDSLARKAEAVDLPGLVIRPIKWTRLYADLHAVYEVFDQAYRTVPDTSPMPFAQFASFTTTFILFTDTRLIQLALVNGKPAGFVACVPEVNEAIPALSGSLSPLAIFRFGRSLRQVKTAAFKLIGVRPEYRGTGIHAAMIAKVVDGVRAGGYTRIDGSLIDERNKPMRGVVEGAGLEIYRRYRFFERPVE